MTDDEIINKAFQILRARRKPANADAGGRPKALTAAGLAKLAKLADLRNQGATLAQLAYYFKVTPQTITRYLKQLDD